MNDYVVPLCSLNANFVFHKIENDKIILPCTTTLQIKTPMKVSNESVYYVLSYSDHKKSRLSPVAHCPLPTSPSVMVMTIPLVCTQSFDMMIPLV